jgi:hypothetical protein
MASGRVPVAAAMVRNTIDIVRVITKTKRKKIKNGEAVVARPDRKYRMMLKHVSTTSLTGMSTRTLASASADGR